MRSSPSPSRLTGQVHARGDGGGVEVEQRLGIAGEVEHDHAPVDARMPRQRQHRRGVHAAGRVALRRCSSGAIAVASSSAPAKRLSRSFSAYSHSFGCAAPEPAREADRGAYVAQRLVRVADAQAVVLGQVLEPEAELPPPSSRARQRDALRPQRVHQPQCVEQVPARIAAAPFAFVGSWKSRYRP